MPIFGPDFVEGKVYRGKKKTEQDEERHALAELQSILNAKNRRSCDCEAQVHDLLENCLNCGRLTCTAEGSGKCFSCGSIVLDPQQRERLRKHVDIVQLASTSGPSSSSGSRSRTQIIDNQFDYFAVDNKKHLSETEKLALRNDIEDLQNKRYKRKLILDVDADNLEASAQAVRVVDDYEEELRKLQIKDEPKELESQFKLSDLVHKESRKNFNFEYVDSSVKRKSLPSKTPTNVQQPKHVHKTKNQKPPHGDRQNQREKGHTSKREGIGYAWHLKDKSKANG